MLWIVALFALFLWKITKGRKKMLWFIPPILLFLGVCSLVWAPLPFVGGSLATWIGTLLGWVLGWLAGLFSASSATAATVAILALAIAAVIDLLDKQPDKWAKTAIVTIPFLAVLATGPIASGVDSITRSVSGHSVSVVANIAS